MSNLYPLVQEARICLRCQYRLANYGAKRRKVQARSFSAQSQNFQEHARADDRASVRQDLFDVPTIPETLLDQSADDIELPKDARPARALEDLGYFFRSANLYSRDPLGRTTLGKPAEVLRLQDNPPRRRDRKWWQVDKEDDNISRSPEPLTSSDILDSVNTDRGLVSEARAIHNIDALKQDWQSRLKDQHLGPTESECDHLRKRAMLGFTRKQLLAYMKKASTLNPQDSTDLHHPFQSALYARSEWRVGVTAFPGDGARRLNDVSGSSWTRYKFVDKLMRQTWGIRSREELQSIGEVDVRIHEAHLYLLSSHNSGILRRIATEYDAKIDCSRVEHILRITANAATCASSLKLLSMVLDDIVCHKYSLGINSKSTRMPTATNEVFNDIQLREIERLSDTVVRWPQNDGGKIQHFPKLLIYYLGQDSKSLEAARRLLGQCRNPLREAKPDVFFAGDDAVFDALAPLPVEASKNLPLTDRGIAWTRLCSGSTESVTDGQAPPSALINVIEHIQPSDNYSTLHQLLGERWNWGIRCVQERSTVLGQLLYPAKTASSRKRSRWDLTQPHVMNTDVPSIRSEFGSLGQEMKLRQEVRIKLQATNGAVLKGAPIRHLPDLELRCVIQVDPDRPDEPSKVILDGVRLVLENRQADLLLPHEPMDMRFATQVYLDATAKPDPRILRFMESCNLSDPDLDPLVMPQSLTIGIPRQIMDPVPQADEKVIDKVSLRKYSLASVERFWILHSDRDGIKAAYSTIDAGAFGGRRQELRFSQCSVPEIKPPVDWLSRQTRSLYHYAYNMVQRTRVGQKMAANISRRDAVMDWVTPNEIERAELRQVGVRRVVSSRLPDFQRWVP